MGTLILLASLGFVLILLRIDRNNEADVSPALWWVLSWMFFAGSRSPSSWTGMGPVFDSAQAFSEGSPFDAAVYFAHIVAALFILARRDIDWPRLLGQNKLLITYLLYCLISAAWSDESVTSLKRWIKDLGNPLLVLLILTDRDPVRAFGWVLRRLAFLVVPLSLVFIRYVPELGRSFSVSGAPMNIGVGTQKNDLGLSCMLTGIYFVWLMVLDRERFKAWSAAQRWACWTMMAGTVYALWLSNSQTSVVCLAVASAVLLLARVGFVRSSPSRLVGLVVGLAMTIVLFEIVFDVSDNVYALLGRNPTLTNRTEVWALLRSFQSDIWIGTGFMSFWSGERMNQMWSLVGAAINQAHNGYLEQYLNLGLVGLSLMCGLLLNALFSARRQMTQDGRMGALRVAVLMAAVLYNYTEASFYGINNMWLMTMLALMQVSPGILRKPENAPSAQPTLPPHGATTQA
jgi:exopolysaccharide production protein ExoQ